MSLALQLAYDGSDFSGFQRLPGQRTVQGELERVLACIFGYPCPVVGAGRTDAGVHAWGQVVSLAAELPVTPVHLQQLLQRQLPPDLSVPRIWTVPAGFQARFCACARHYRYRLSAVSDPFQNRYRWHYASPFKPALLAEVWQACEGEWDFSALARPDPNRRSGRLRVWLARMHTDAQELTLDIIADRFLHTLVRRLVGTALDIARGRLPQDYLQAVLSGALEPSQPRGRLAPAHGLYFCRALYPQAWGIEVAYPAPLPEPLPFALPEQPMRWWD